MLVPKSTSFSEKFFYLAIVFALLFSVYFRFTDPLSGSVADDEIVTMISAIKLNISHPAYDPRLYVSTHPYLGKWLMASIIDKDADYTNIKAMPKDAPGDWRLSYLTVKEVKNQEMRIRFISALFGILALIPVFLIGRELFGLKTGLLSAALVGLWSGFINLSRLQYQDATLPFFFFFSVYFQILFLKQPEQGKLFSKETLFLFGVLVFLYLCFLIRIGQPLFLLASVVICILLKNRLKTKILGFLGVVASIVFAVFSIGIDPIKILIEY